MKYPSFDVNVPPWIRYDPELNDFEKLFYIEIRAMTDLKGYCWATNKYFMKLFNKSESTIKRALNKLKSKNYIDVFTEKEKGNKRKIFIASYPTVINDPSPTVKNDPTHSLLTNSNKDFNNKDVTHKNYKAFKNKKQYKSKNELPEDVKIDWFDNYLKKRESE